MNSSDRQAHTVVVVLADKDDGQLPQIGHVVGLEDLSLIGSTVTVQCQAHATVTLVLAGQSNTGTQRHLSAHNTVAAIEIGCIHVHGTALAARTTGLNASQLGQYTYWGYTHQICPAMDTVCRDNVVHITHGRLHADSAGLLTGVQMTETAYNLLLVQIAGGCLNATYRLHLCVVFECLILG